ncbi:hypothetical protein U0027_23935 (plasmid) [Agrobacterium tumefaciens]|uniref:hypothetical protein n=1 Tax=Agrobacterium tumefaciens TaxID=358 RepID=UPI0013B37614|nr:hypothetical protein [Agrobacterium tumefaciens]WQE43473.1 hypothetical protein U0027_23935 [Agrobacterium tumefaciens]
MAGQLARSWTREQPNSPPRAALLQQRGFSQDHPVYRFLVLAGRFVSVGVTGLAIQLLVGFLINKFSGR